MNKKLKNLIGSNLKLDENALHRAKVTKRKQEIFKQKNDMLNEQLFEETFNGTHPVIGEYGKQKSKIAKYEKLVWRILIGLGITLIVISWFI